MLRRRLIPLPPAVTVAAAFAVAATAIAADPKPLGPRTQGSVHGAAPAKIGMRPAAGRTVTWPSVVSPSKLISCHAVKYGGPAIECMAGFLPELGPLDSYFLLRPHGFTVYAERGDYTGYDVPRRALRYGDVWKRRGVRCTMQRTGLTCRNLDGHGFHLQKGNIRRF